jgi:hypothetical protein
MDHRSANASRLGGVAVVKRAAGPGPHVVVRSIAFTPAALEALEDLAANVALLAGKKASASAVVRALLRLATDVPDVKEKLAALIEHEQVNELVSWGKPPKTR